MRDKYVNALAQPPSQEPACKTTPVEIVYQHDNAPSRALLRLFAVLVDIAQNRDARQLEPQGDGRETSDDAVCQRPSRKGIANAD